MKHRYSRYTVRLVKEDTTLYEIDNIINHPKEVYKVATDILKMHESAEEVFEVLALDNQKKIIGMFEVARGTINAALIHPREVFKRLCLLNTSSFVCIHNHPSGKTNPSSEDNELTKKMKKSGELMGITMVDHVIIGDGGYYSYKEDYKL